MTPTFVCKRFPLFVVALLVSVVLQAQPRNKDYIKVEVGYTSTFVTDPANMNIFSSRHDTTFVTGSNFVGAQSGLSIRTNFELGERRRIIIPVGLDFTFMRGLQRLENPGLTGHGAVSLNMTSIVAGCQYRFVDLPLAAAFLYGGVEARGSFIGGANFRYEVNDYTTGKPIPVFGQDTTLKEATFRLGGAVRLGCQGIISDPLRINVSAAYGVMNLIGRDLRTESKDRRGELLTPTRINEANESFATFTQLSIWLQYYF